MKQNIECNKNIVTEITTVTNSSVYVTHTSRCHTRTMLSLMLSFRWWQTSSNHKEVCNSKFLKHFKFVPYQLREYQHSVASFLQFCEELVQQDGLATGHYQSMHHRQVPFTPPVTLLCALKQKWVVAALLQLWNNVQKRDMTPATGTWANAPNMRLSQSTYWQSTWH